MGTKKNMTPSLEDYLKTIYLLHKAGDDIRIIDIAERMSVSKPSVVNAVSQLTDMGMVEHEKFGPVHLLDQGIETAKKLTAKYETIKQFLIQVLNIDEVLAGFEACAIEHTIHDATLAKMELLL